MWAKPRAGGTIFISDTQLSEINTIQNVFEVQYIDNILVVRCSSAKHNLVKLMNYLQDNDITFGRVFSELPTLNDVFLEITGKKLRD